MSEPVTVSIATVVTVVTVASIALWCALVFGALACTLSSTRRELSAPDCTSNPLTTRRRGSWRRRLRRRRVVRRLDRAFPDALEMFVLVLQSGAMPVTAMRALTHHDDPSIRAAFSDSCARLDRGEVLDEALDAVVSQLGSRALTLVDTIRSCALTGLPLAPMVERLADDAREHRRRHAEMAARQLPVRLSFPLVMCTLPSFVLVAIVPLVVGAVSSLNTG